MCSAFAGARSVFPLLKLPLRGQSPSGDPKSEHPSDTALLRVRSAVDLESLRCKGDPRLSQELTRISPMGGRESERERERERERSESIGFSLHGHVKSSCQ